MGRGIGRKKELSSGHCEPKVKAEQIGMATVRVRDGVEWDM